MSERTTYKLGEIGTFIGGVSSIKKDDYGHGTPFLPYKNVYKNSKVNINELELMNVKPAELQRRGCIYGDIFFTASSETPDEVAMSSVLLEEVENLTFNGFCKRYRLHDFETLLPEYARYLFRSPSFRREVYQVATGDIRFNISQESLGKIEIEIPDVVTQKELASILSSLDDKIELNLQMNQTLEAMAQAIFKEWFVNFNFPGFDGELVDGLPKGWRMGKLNEIAEISKSTLSPSSSPDTTFKHYSIPAFDTGMVPALDKGDTILSNKFVVKSNSILVSKLNPRISRIWFVLEIDEDVSISSTEFLVVQPKDLNSYSFLFYFLKFPSTIDTLIGLASGTSGSHQRIKPNDILDLSLVIPDVNTITQFNDLVIPSFGKKQINIDESQTLIKVRDTLLPKLMTGKIEVKS